MVERRPKRFNHPLSRISAMEKTKRKRKRKKKTARRRPFFPRRRKKVTRVVAV